MGLHGSNALPEFTRVCSILVKMEEWDVEQVVAWAQLHKLTAALDPETIRSNDIEGELLKDLDDEARQHSKLVLSFFSPNLTELFHCASCLRTDSFTCIHLTCVVLTPRLHAYCGTKDPRRIRGKRIKCSPVLLPFPSLP